jgi:5-(carboxyamino)imidazole ribonucleotide synthase
MKNIIGDKSGKAELKGLEEAYHFSNVKVHIYGKETVSKGRKMGHITATADTLEEALAQVRGAYDKLSY